MISSSAWRSIAPSIKSFWRIEPSTRIFSNCSNHRPIRGANGPERTRAASIMPRGSSGSFCRTSISILPSWLSRRDCCRISRHREREASVARQAREGRFPKMSHESSLPGVLAPVLTPFKRNREPDTELYVRFCRWLHGKGAGLAIFGTNSEANSMSVEERSDLLAAVIAGGLPARALLPGTGSCAIPDSVRLSAQAAKAGCAGVLMLPPFYYKPVSEEGLFAAYSEVVERVGDPGLKILLYHIPQLSSVPIPVG